MVPTSIRYLEEVSIEAPGCKFCADKAQHVPAVKLESFPWNKPKTGNPNFPIKLIKAKIPST